MIQCITSGWWDAIADTGTAIATFTLAYVAYDQLKKLIQSNNTANLVAVLDHEAEITKRKVRLDEISCEIEEYALNKVITAEKVEILNRKLNSAIEDYLNSIDRLAYCIIKGHFLEKDWKREYRLLIQNVVFQYEDLLGPQSPYINIIDINDKWRRE